MYSKRKIATVFAAGGVLALAPLAAAQAEGTGGSESAGSVPNCQTDQLSPTVTPVDAGAGHTYYQVAFTNTGDTTCFLDGHPGVSMVGGDDGHQIGSPADFDATAPTEIVLAPGQSAAATLDATHAENYDPAVCAPEEARGFRIYAPDETDAMYVPYPIVGCQNPDVHLMGVTPVVAI